MAEVTIDAKTAADALGVSTFYLASYMREGAAESLERLAGYIRKHDREPYGVEVFDEHIEDSRRLLDAADACQIAWKAELYA
jgi:hypothetical protein